MITEKKKKTTWKEGAPVPYKVLTSVFSKIQDTTKRLEITKMLENFFRDVIELTPEDLKASVYLACNKIAPQFENIELGIGDSFLIKAITTSTGRSTKRVKSDYEKSGDLGIVAEQSRSSQKTLFKPKPLTVRNVYKVFRKIANISGNKSQAKKVSEITRLLAACSKEEARFLIRGLQGKLRIGLASQTVNVALATALTPRNTKKEKVEEAIEIFKHVMSECPSYVMSHISLSENQNHSTLNRNTGTI
jgi:DNA ligase-1